MLPEDDSGIAENISGWQIPLTGSYTFHEESLVSWEDATMQFHSDDSDFLSTANCWFGACLMGFDTTFGFDKLLFGRPTKIK
jgi:hypothetical protein